MVYNSCVIGKPYKRIRISDLTFMQGGIIFVSTNTV